MVRNSRSGDRTSCDGWQTFPATDPQRRSETLFPAERALTAREREVLKLLAEGKTVRAAATVLGLSSKTVDAHKFNLMRKLGIHNKAELVMWAIQKEGCEDSSQLLEAHIWAHAAASSARLETCRSGCPSTALTAPTPSALMAG